MSDKRLAEQLDCTVSEATTIHATAVAVVRTADVRETMRKLNELAVSFNMTATELVAAYG